MFRKENALSGRTGELPRSGRSISESTRHKVAHRPRPTRCPSVHVGRRYHTYFSEHRVKTESTRSHENCTPLSSLDIREVNVCTLRARRATVCVHVYVCVHARQYGYIVNRLSVRLTLVRAKRTPVQRTATSDDADKETHDRAASISTWTHTQTYTCFMHRFVPDRHTRWTNLSENLSKGIYPPRPKGEC